MCYYTYFDHILFIWKTKLTRNFINSFCIKLVIKNKNKIQSLNESIILYTVKIKIESNLKYTTTLYYIQ